MPIHVRRHVPQVAAQASQLAAGVRATAGTVGYLGAAGDLTVINPGQSLAGTPFAGGTWSGNFLEHTGSNITADHCRFNCGLWLTGSNITLTNCKMVLPNGCNFGVYYGSSSGRLTIEDSTVSRANPGTVGDIPSAMITSEGQMTLKRVDVSMGGDNIHCNVTGGTTSAPGVLLSQVYAHANASVDPEQHADGIQWFNLGGVGRVEHSRVECKGGAGNLSISSAMTCGTEDQVSPLTTVEINNTFYSGGQNHLRINNRVQDIRVTNCDFGPIWPSAGAESWEVWEIDVDPTSSPNIVEWSGNRRSDGSLIPQP